jgi:predicted GIY-YIG superfamily endonuclease
MYCAQLKGHSDALKAEIWLKKQTRKTKDAIIQQQLTVPSVIRLLDAEAIQRYVGNKLSD